MINNVTLCSFVNDCRVSMRFAYAHLSLRSDALKCLTELHFQENGMAGE